MTNYITKFYKILSTLWCYYNDPFYLHKVKINFNPVSGLIISLACSPNKKNARFLLLFNYLLSLNDINYISE